MYCAGGLREAEAVFRVARARGVDVALEVGHESAAGGSGLVVTVPRVLRRAVVDSGAYGWMQRAGCVVLNEVVRGDVPEWEEIILGMASDVLLCVCASELDAFEQDEIPLWMETVQNSTVPVAPRGMMRFCDRIDRPVYAPPVRGFVFNAALQDCPVQVSLPLVIEELKKDFASAPWRGRLGSGKRGRRRGGGGARRPGANAAEFRSPQAGSNMDDIVAAANVEYANALLPGVVVIAAADVTSIMFSKAAHANFADVAALVLADARDTEERVTSAMVAKKRTASSKRRKKTAATLFTDSLRRRKRVEANLLPALVIIHGRAEAEAAAGAVQSTLAAASVSAVCDPAAVETLDMALHLFKADHTDNLTEHDIAFLESLRAGVGFIHRGLLPALRSLAEELFRDGLVQVLCVDSHLGPKEAAQLPRARSVLVQSTCFGEQSDMVRGLLKGSLLGTLAGRTGVDEVGNLVGLWFDNDVDDEETSTVLAASLFADDIAQEHARFGPGTDTIDGASAASSSYRSSRGRASGGQLSSALLATAMPGLARHSSRRSGSYLTTYPGLLGALRRHGEDGYKTVIGYALDSYRGWLVGAGLRATREKVEVEKRAVDEYLADVAWDELAAHDRIASKLNTQRIAYRTMVARQPAVVADRLLTALKAAKPGTIIGLVSPENRLLTSSVESESEQAPKPSSATEDGKDGDDRVLKGDADGISKNEDMVPAILVSVLDNVNERSEQSPVMGDVLVVCLLVDGMWTLAPLSDVCAISEGDAVAPNVDLIPLPHLAAFDSDPATLWAKCTPVSDEEISRINDASEALITSLMMRSDSTRLEPFKLDAIAQQESRLQSAQKAYDASPWSGREAEAINTRRLRRRALELGDEASNLRASETRLEDNIQTVQNNLNARLRAELAVLEDCNSISVGGDGSMEMTPIGVLSSVLPGPHPLFAAACLILVSSLDKLSPAQLAAFVLILVAKRKRKGLGIPGNKGNKDRNMFDSILQDDDSGAGYAMSSEISRGEVVSRSGMTERQDENAILAEFLPEEVVEEMEKIRSALHVVQERHFDSGELVKLGKPLIAPAKVELQSADALFKFVDGQFSWPEAVESQDLQSGELVRDFRLCAETLRVMTVKDSGLGEISDVQLVASKALEALSVWPICGTVGDDENLVKAGVAAGTVATRKVSASYKTWWASAEAEIDLAVKEAETFVELKDAEVMESETG